MVNICLTQYPQVNILWLYDEFTDTESGEEAVKAAGIVSRALREPDYNDGTWICRMMKSYAFIHLYSLQKFKYLHQ